MSKLLEPFKVFCKENRVEFKRNTIYLRKPEPGEWTPFIRVIKYNKEEDKYYVVCKRHCHWKSNDFSDWLTGDEIIDVIKKDRGIKSYDIRANKSA